jgi:hypothetical protein
MATPYELREQEFGQEYEDFEPASIHQLMVRTGEWLELLLMNKEVVNDVMRLIYEQVVDERGLPVANVPWRELWAEIDESSAPMLSQFMIALNAYAYWGLHPDPMGTFVDLESEDVGPIEAFVLKAREFLNAVPPTWGTTENLTRTVLAAEARELLDSGFDITPEQLAALARVSIKSIRNLVTPKGGLADLRPGDSGLIANEDAMRWLLARPSFKPSIWREAAGRPLGVSMATVLSPDLGDVIFVPVAKDGSRFDPETCRRNGGYTIGPKGAEEKVENYREAVARLTRMPVPQWRRPNPQGHWGIVSGVSWQRRAVAETSGSDMEDV